MLKAPLNSLLSGNWTNKVSVNNSSLKAIAICSLFLTASMVLYGEFSDDYIEVNGHNYESILLQLERYDDAHLLGLASKSMQNGEFSRSESLEFFSYAIKAHSPIEMAPVYRNTKSQDTYPLDISKTKLLNFIDKQEPGPEGEADYIENE